MQWQNNANPLEPHADEHHASGSCAHHASIDAPSILAAYWRTLVAHLLCAVLPLAQEAPSQYDWRRILSSFQVQLRLLDAFIGFQGPFVRSSGRPRTTPPASPYNQSVSQELRS